MSYFEIYKSRLLAAGSTPDEVTINNTKMVINNSFDSSLFSIQVPVDGVLTDVVVNQGKTSNEKTLLLKPDNVIDKGAIVDIDGLFYLVMDFDSNKVYPIAKAQMCNTAIKVKTNEIRVLLRDENGKVITDSDGRPQYEEIEGTVKNEPCIVESKGFAVDGTQIVIPDDTLLVTLQYQKADNLKVNGTISLYDDDYQIKYIDQTNVINNKGIMILTVENVSDKAVNL